MCRLKDVTFLIGGPEREAVVLEGAEAAGQRQVRRTADVAVLPPEQQHPDPNIAQSPELEGEGHQREIR